jgi:hypothetical protein
VDRVDPADLPRRFDGLDIEVHDHRLAVASHENALEGLVRGGVDLLVRDEGRNIDEIARTSFRGVLQPAWM